VLHSVFLPGFANIGLQTRVDQTLRHVGKGAINFANPVENLRSPPVETGRLKTAYFGTVFQFDQTMSDGRG